MYFDDHGPPHFHAYYQAHESIVEIATLQPLAGDLPKRALAMVQEWAALRHEELLLDWQLAKAHRPLHPIDPLE